MSELKVLTTEEVAKTLHCTVRTVYRLLLDGTLPGRKLGGKGGKGGKWIMLEDDLRKWISEGGNTPRTPQAGAGAGITGNGG